MEEKLSGYRTNTEISSDQLSPTLRYLSTIWLQNWVLRLSWVMSHGPLTGNNILSISQGPMTRYNMRLQINPLATAKWTQMTRKRFLPRVTQYMALHIALFLHRLWTIITHEITIGIHSCSGNISSKNGELFYITIRTV